MDEQLLVDIEQVAEGLKRELYAKVPRWMQAHTPAAFFDFEQELQTTLNAVQSSVVGAVLEAMHRDHVFVAQCKRQALHDLGMENSGFRARFVRTLGGNRIRITTPYIHAPVTSRDPGGRRTHRREGAGLSPVLRSLGIVRGLTPRLLAEVTRHMADGPSGAEARERLASREIAFPQKTMWYQVRDFACIALWQRQLAAAHLDQVETLQPAPIAGQRVVVGIDGGRLRVRVNKAHNGQRITTSFSGDNCEPKLFVIYSIDEKGNKKRDGVFVYDGTLQSHEMLFSLLKLRLKELGVAQAAALVIIGDGASWIWRGAAELHHALNIEHVPVFEIVDFAHAAGKLMGPARLGITDRFRRTSWFRRMRKLLRDGKVDEVIEALSGLDRSRDEDGEIARAVGYFQNHRARMQYPQYREAGLPIGSGVIESGVRRIVNYRLRGASIFWSPEKAEQLLYLRCQIKSGQWTPFFKSVLSTWADDMSVPLPSVYQILGRIRQQFLDAHPPASVESARMAAIHWARHILSLPDTIIVDTETTGLEDGDEIIQLAVIDPQGNTILARSFRPTVSISQVATAVHGITNTELANAPTFAESFQSVSNTLRNKNIIAYNAEFDQRLLLQTCEKYGLRAPEKTTWHCAMEKYASFMSERRGKHSFKRYSLAAACQQQDISIGEVHEAVHDCCLTLELVRAMASADDVE